MDREPRIVPDLTLVAVAPLAALALSHVVREYPCKLDHVIGGPHDLRSPRELHPLFYGSFDWHSNVHAYWLLASLYRTRPDLPQRDEIRALFNVQITATKVQGELAYLREPFRNTFERPYGWAWLLMLAAELKRHDEGWSSTLQPLADSFVDRFREWLGKASYPSRAGAHSNTAFAIALALEYEDEPLRSLLRHKALEWYSLDVDCQAWEPGGDDFLSPALIEAECMRRAMPEGEWRVWFDKFLPGVHERRPATLFQPATVTDRTDGKIAHLDGLNLTRAWCWRSVASSFREDDPRRGIALESAAKHLEASLPQVAGDYMGEHWLATFALLALGV
jgi:hypothetical protein